jgi:hypothetical protein
VEKLLNKLVENLKTILSVLFCNLDARHQRLVAEVMEIIVTCIECGMIQVDWNDFSVDSLGVYD